MNAPELRHDAMTASSAEESPTQSAGWRARLDLAFARRGSATIPVLRSHRGPLRVQKGFTPEGEGLWHQVIVHPPGGIASGDHLDIAIAMHPGSRALVTSPGAAKWYRANPDAVDGRAYQSLNLKIEDGASLEWLPLETIVFDGALTDWTTRIELTGSASLIAADLVCLGRPASGSRFDSGEIRSRLDICRDGQPIFFEQVRLQGGSPVLGAQAGLAGLPAFGTLVIALDSSRVGAVVDRVRTLHDTVPGDWAITGLPGLAVLRWRGTGAETGWRVLRAAWAACRPLVVGREACAPRIWAT